MTEEGKRARRILILEDSPSQAQKLGNLLSTQGYTVTRAVDGLDGLYKLADIKPDLVISDVWMPRLTGFEFCSAMKNDLELSSIPIILLTTLAARKDLIEGLNSGADYYLTKPYNEQLLLSMVDFILANWNYSSNGNSGPEIELTSAGSAEKIKAKPEQIVNFLFSTHENLITNNRELIQAKQALLSINNELEEKVKEKTLSLEKEVEEREKANTALKKILSGTVGALARAVEMRDLYTAGHQQRVSEISNRIGKKLALSPDQLEGLRVMGLLHDIGKIIVPAEILTKPSQLNDYEFLCIKAHPQAGHDILKDIDFPWPVATAILQHHERLNGSGYPLGLPGPNILIEAKILAVADVFESMSSHRPYRPAFSIEIALQELSDHQGVLYDPEVVAAARQVLKSEPELTVASSLPLSD
jgi:putative two-component system response regulator